MRNKNTFPPQYTYRFAEFATQRDTSAASRRALSPVQALTARTLSFTCLPCKPSAVTRALPWLTPLTVSKRRLLTGAFAMIFYNCKYNILSNILDIYTYIIFIRNNFDAFDRPIAGHANLCPGSISTKPQELETLLSTVKHEILHALGFSVSLYAFFRDEKGEPRTPRRPDTGKPPLNEKYKIFIYEQ